MTGPTVISSSLEGDRTAVGRTPGRRQFDVRGLQAVELWGAAQRVGPPAGGTERVGHTQQEPAAVDPEHRRAGRGGDRDVRVQERTPADGNAALSRPPPPGAPPP